MCVHLSETCPYRSVECEWCGHIVPFKGLEYHKDEVCPCRIVSCGLGCGIADLMWKDKFFHEDELCPNRVVPCGWCGQLLKACEVIRHFNKTCMHRPAQCIYGCGVVNLTVLTVEAHQRCCPCRPAKAEEAHEAQAVAQAKAQAEKDARQQAQQAAEAEAEAARERAAAAKAAADELAVAEGSPDVTSEETVGVAGAPMQFHPMQFADGWQAAQDPLSFHIKPESPTQSTTSAEPSLLARAPELDLSVYLNNLTILPKGDEQDDPIPFHPSQVELEQLEEYVKDLFAVGDTNNDGVLELAEMAQLLSYSGFDLPAATILDIVEVADLNKNGVIEYAEFVPVVTGLLQTLKQAGDDDEGNVAEQWNDLTDHELEDYLRQLFAVADENNDGVLQPKEYVQLMRLSGLKFPDEVVLQGFLEADANTNGVIEYEELVPAFKAMLVAARDGLSKDASADMSPEASSQIAPEAPAADPPGKAVIGEPEEPEAGSTAWTGFGDYVESLGEPMTGSGDKADFEAMLEAALAKEAVAIAEAALAKEAVASAEAALANETTTTARPVAPITAPKGSTELTRPERSPNSVLATTESTNETTFTFPANPAEGLPEITLQIKRAASDSPQGANELSMKEIMAGIYSKHGTGIGPDGFAAREIMEKFELERLSAEMLTPPGSPGVDATSFVEDMI